MVGDEDVTFHPATVEVPRSNILKVQTAVRGPQPIDHTPSPTVLQATLDGSALNQRNWDPMVNPAPGKTIKELTRELFMGKGKRLPGKKVQAKMETFKQNLIQGKYAINEHKCNACGISVEGVHTHQYSENNYGGCGCGIDVPTELNFSHDSDCQLKDVMARLAERGRPTDQMEYPTWSCFTVFRCEFGSRLAVVPNKYCYNEQCNWELCGGDAKICESQERMAQVWEDHEEFIEVGAARVDGEDMPKGIPEGMHYKEIGFNYGPTTNTRRSSISSGVHSEVFDPIALKELHDQQIRREEANKKISASVQGLYHEAQDMSWETQSGLFGLRMILSHLGYYLNKNDKGCVRYEVRVPVHPHMLRMPKNEFGAGGKVVSVLLRVTNGTLARFFL